VQPTVERVTFRDVFAVSEFRALWAAQVLSVAGDQLARVALTILVYDRTRSPLLAAITYAASIVPAFIGGIVLAGLADRFSRRAVMIACDLLRALLVVAMVIPGMPFTALVALLFTVTLVGAPFTAARAAIYPDVLPGDRYPLGTAVTLTTYQFAQVAGFAAGGAVVGLFGVRATLLLDALTFAASALIVRLAVCARPVPWQPERTHPLTDAVAGIRLVFGNAALRTPMLFGWLAACYVVPEGVAAPLAHAAGGGAAAVGLVLGAVAAGSSVGGIAFTRFAGPALRQRLLGPFAVACGAALMLIVFRPALPLSLLILALSGLFDCYQIAANAAFVSAAPPRQRGQAFGLAIAGMSLGQGAAVIAAGAAAQRLAPTDVIAAAGALGAVAALALTLTRSARR
jgi:predicted MFS family arabinose efflux permease